MMAPDMSNRPEDRAGAGLLAPLTSRLEHAQHNYIIQLQDACPYLAEAYKAAWHRYRELRGKKGAGEAWNDLLSAMQALQDAGAARGIHQPTTRTTETNHD